MTNAISEKPILFSAPMIRAILDGRKVMTRRVVTKQNSETAVPWDRLEFDESKWPKGLGFGFLADANGFKKGGYLHVPTRPHPDDPQDVADDWTRNRVYPKWNVGDRLWVRETFCQKTEDGVFVYNSEGNLDPSCYHYAADGYEVLKDDGDGGTEYRKDGSTASPWKPSIFMPRYASRITLEITDVRVERLQEITEEDARAEGFQGGDGRPENGFNTESPFPARAAFAGLWDELNRKRGVCKTCKGHGVVPAWSGSVSGGSLAQDAKDCPDCKGSETGFGWEQNPFVWVIEFKRIQ